MKTPQTFDEWWQELQRRPFQQRTQLLMPRLVAQAAWEASEKRFAELCQHCGKPLFQCEQEKRDIYDHNRGN